MSGKIENILESILVWCQMVAIPCNFLSYSTPFPPTSPLMSHSDHPLPHRLSFVNLLSFRATTSPRSYQSWCQTTKTQKPFNIVMALRRICLVLAKKNFHSVKFSFCSPLYWAQSDCKEETENWESSGLIFHQPLRGSTAHPAPTECMPWWATGHKSKNESGLLPPPSLGIHHCLNSRARISVCLDLPKRCQLQSQYSARPASVESGDEWK